ncbi:MAG: hypothetical protein Q7T74_03230 [Candidatus Saccharibacteria bacterium]|nr:hypothetical protein [Candidatus Saccharibacteria bacterium]
MKYHYQKGIVEKDKKGHKKGWLGFFVAMTVVAYSGLLFTVLDLNGWPVSGIDTAAKVVKTVKPTTGKIYIPAINVVADAGSIKIKGDPSYSDVIVSGSTIGFGVTPASIRQASPFYNLEMLKAGDEIFLDNQGTRYVYKVTKGSVSEDDTKLTIKTSNNTVVAKTVGTLDWSSGKPNLESF